MNRNGRPVKARTAHGANTLRGEYYTSAKILRQERERIFANHWLNVGRGSQIPRSGDYFLYEIDLGGGMPESIIVLRDEAGAVRAHYNVCRHRGTRLCTASTGQFSRTIQCPYHAWTYTLDGTLIGAHNMHDVESFDRAEYPLHGVAVAEWEGFIFLNFAPDPQPFAEAYVPLLGRFDDWDLASLHVAAQAEYEVAANWKLIFQNYNECYHCPTVHPVLNQLTPFKDASNDVEEGPFLGGPMRMSSVDGSMTMSGLRGAPPLGTVSGANLGAVYYFTIFPSFFLSLHPDYVLIHRIEPQSTDRTIVRCEWLFHPDAMAASGFSPADAVDFWDMTNRQDWHVCELSQLGVSSRIYTPGPYAELESVLAAFDREYLRVMNA